MKVNKKNHKISGLDFGFGHTYPLQCIPAEHDYVKFNDEFIYCRKCGWAILVQQVVDINIKNKE